MQGLSVGGTGKRRKSLVLAQQVGGNVTQMAHRTLQDHNKEVNLSRNRFSSKIIDVFKLMLLMGMYQCQHILNWEKCLGT